MGKFSVACLPKAPAFRGYLFVYENLSVTFLVLIKKMQAQKYNYVALFPFLLSSEIKRLSRKYR